MFLSVEMVFIYMARSVFLSLAFPIGCIVCVVVFASLCAKNCVRLIVKINWLTEIPETPIYVLYLLQMTSLLAFGFSLMATYTNMLFGSFMAIFVPVIAMVAIYVSVVITSLKCQRVSLRTSIGLSDNFIDAQKKKWKTTLNSFPHCDELIKELDSAHYSCTLFDRGAFNLTVLWSCNVMEKIIDTSINGITEQNPNMEQNFKKNDGRWSDSYSKKLKNFGYVHKQRMCRKSEQRTIEKLWHDIRIKIAHKTKLPSFDETYGTLAIFVAFIEEFPKTLLAYSTLFFYKSK
jgi:hypothetical protein